MRLRAHLAHELSSPCRLATLGPSLAVSLLRQNPLSLSPATLSMASSSPTLLTAFTSLAPVPSRRRRLPSNQSSPLPTMVATTKPRRRVRVSGPQRVAPPPPVARGRGRIAGDAVEVIGGCAAPAMPAAFHRTPAPRRRDHTPARTGAAADAPFSSTVTHSAPPSSAFASFSDSGVASEAAEAERGAREGRSAFSPALVSASGSVSSVSAGSSICTANASPARTRTSSANLRPLNPSATFSVPSFSSSGVVDDVPRTVSRYARPVPKALPHEILPRRRGRDALKRVEEAEHFRKYMFLRRQLKPWSEKFQDTHGRTPNLEDVHKAGVPGLLERFVEYLDALEGLRRY